ncbi:MAG: hypothetical protein AUI36_37830 [Cyanobacteria bacterium 13_1_40CM_2_61_4]|nr:MAG: hypothetical protein AUI36_37830 [Cyanobacteria bacterium 13_1_40CM_2_61_4]
MADYARRSALRAAEDVVATPTAARTPRSRESVRGSAECSGQHVLLPTRRWPAEQAATPRNCWSLEEDEISAARTAG